MNIKKLFTGLLIAILLPLLSACDEGDDVAQIFTGKTWKLTYIALEGQHKQFDFWNNDAEAQRRSMQLLEGEANFTLTFYGGDEKSEGAGEFDGVGANQQFSGRWNADGVSRELHISNISATAGSSETDILARAFVNGLPNATSYSGDDQNLFIYYTDGQTTKCMAFHIQR